MGPLCYQYLCSILSWKFEVVTGIVWKKPCCLLMVGRSVWTIVLLVTEVGIAASPFTPLMLSAAGPAMSYEQL